MPPLPGPDAADTIDAAGGTDEFETAFAEFAAAPTSTDAEPPLGRDSIESAAGAMAAAAAAMSSQAPTVSGAAAATTAAPVTTATGDFDWSAADPRAREAYEALRSSTAGRIRGYQKKLAELPAITTTAVTSPTVATVVAKPDAPDASATGVSDWEKFKSEYPELAAPVDARMAEIRQSVEQRFEPIARTVVENQQSEAIRAEEKILADAHPDWQKQAGSKAFKDWCEQQPTYVFEAINRNATFVSDGAEVADIIERFKNATGQTTRTTPGTGTEPVPDPQQAAAAEKRRRQLEAAAAVRAGGGGQGEGPPDDFEAAFHYYATHPRKRA